jgi:hypothetical protein
MPSRNFWILLTFSTAVHSFAVLPAWNGPGQPNAAPQDPILISYVNFPPPQSRRASKPAMKPIGEPAASMAPVAIAAVKPVVEPTEKPIEISKYTRKPRPHVSRRPVRPSAELLSDPQIGKIFSGYFQAVKERIHQKVRRKYSRENVGPGSVALFFVLGADGALKEASVVDAESQSDPPVRDFAVDCLKEAAPFPPFPSSFHSENISFHVMVLFEEL